MKNPFDNLDKVLEHKARLQIISVLVANESFDFNSIKELLTHGWKPGNAYQSTGA